MRKFNVLPVLLLTLPLMLAGCLDSDDEDDNPNDDSIWSLVPDSGGLDRSFTRFEDGSNLTEVVSGALSPECVAIDTNGDTANDGSKLEAFTFAASASGGGTGAYTVSVFLADTECSVFTADYADVVEFNYEAWSSSFDFNRIDITATAVGRLVNTDAAVTALNDVTACTKTDWVISQSLASTADCSSADADLNKLTGFQFNDSEMPVTVGSVLQGIFIVSGSLLSIAIDEEGARPSGTVDTSNNDYWVINGADIYYQY